MRHLFTRYLAAGSAAILATLSGTLAPLAGAEDPAPTALVDLENSIVLIETKWTGFIFVPANASASNESYWTEELTYSTTCTAFFVSTSAQLATAGHCVDPADGRRVILEGYINDQEAPDYLDEAIANWLVEGAEAGQPVQRAVFGYQPENVDGAMLTARPSTLEVVDFKPSDSGDVALLRVPDLSKPTPAMPIAEAAPEVGDDLTSIGFPGILRNISDQTQIARASFKSGTASSRQVSPQGVVQIEVNTDLQGGMSGGPTVNAAGQVVGVNSSGFNATGNFNFVTNTADLRSFLSSNTVDFVEGEVAAPEEGGSKAGTILLIAGVLLVVALIGGGVFILMKRRPSSPPSAFGGHSPPPFVGSPQPPHFGPSGPAAPAGNFGFGPPSGPPQGYQPSPPMGMAAAGQSNVTEPAPPGFGRPQNFTEAVNTGRPPVPGQAAASGSRLCPSCGAQNQGNERFCSQCGFTIG